VSIKKEKISKLLPVQRRSDSIFLENGKMNATVLKTTTHMFLIATSQCCVAYNDKGHNSSQTYLQPLKADFRMMRHI
jgi:hypothetical protein